MAGDNLFVVIFRFGVVCKHVTWKIDLFLHEGKTRSVTFSNGRKNILIPSAVHDSESVLRRSLTKQLSWDVVDNGDNN